MMMFQARFVGRQNVRGAISEFGLSDIVAELRSRVKKLHESDLRCEIEVNDGHLVISHTRRDEGFESDGDESNHSGRGRLRDVKIESDETSGADSGDDSLPQGSIVTNNGGHSTCSTPLSSASASPTVELQKADRKEVHLLKDVLLCHTSSTVVVWVVRRERSPNSTGSVEAIVFEGQDEEQVRQIYRKFLESSKRCKLERHRRMKSGSSQVEVMPANSAAQSWNLVQKTDKNGITHIEVEQSKSEKSKFAKELETILSKEIEQRKKMTQLKDVSGSPVVPNTSANNTTSPTTIIPTIVCKDNLTQSVRQRAPALLLRKLDDKMWLRKDTTDSSSDIGSSKVSAKSNMHSDRLINQMISRTPPPASRYGHKMTSQVKADVLNAESGTTILIPTKTGKEPVKKLYPKDPLPPAMFRFVAIPIQMSSHQPMSLPIYPIQMAPMQWTARIPAVMADFNDTSGNASGPMSLVSSGGVANFSLSTSQHLPGNRASRMPEIAMSSRGRSREVSCISDLSSGRRAQSKSPARRYNNSDLSKKFREIGDAFRQKIGRRVGGGHGGHGGQGGQSSVFTSSSSQSEINGQLKSNLKKQQNNSTDDGKKVHFNKFATVQMMDP